MSDYETIFTAHVKKLIDLNNKEKEIRSEIDKVAEMVKVSFSLMSAEEQTRFTGLMQEAIEQVMKEDMGLTDAVRKLLESNPNEWFDAIKVRDRLNQNGFDFSGYTSNPLASIHTVLKRFKRKEVKTRKNAVGMNEYRSVIRNRRNAFAYPPVHVTPRKVSYEEMLQGKLNDMKQG